MEGLLPDALRRLFLGGGTGPAGGSGRRPPGRGERGRAERLSQQREGVDRAAAALPDRWSDLGGPCRDAAEELSTAAGAPEGSVEALRRLHYLMVRLEVDHLYRSEEENEALAGRVREALKRVRELADRAGEGGGAPRPGTEAAAGAGEGEA